ncbi:MAG TPA: IPT/TIG domain-containing protein [Candidatus Acidoferrales bacterium]|nr:IPT/TIG domain-containing protein [Candidatus Acidoferrales bacterium]
MRSRFYAVTVAAALILLASCGSSSSAFNPTPAISGLFPDSATANDMSGTACTSGSPVPVNIAGSGFIANSQALWNGTNRTTTFNPNTNQLVVELLACDLTTQGIAQVTVSNPAPGGGTSAAATFTINPANNPLPVISSISPTSTAVGALPPGGAITINASDASSGFVQDSIVAFNGAQRPTTFVSSTQLTAQVQTSDVAANASINVTVDNPTPGGGVSAPFVFTVGTGAAARIFPAVVSISAQGGGANGPSAAPAMSSDGRYVAFFSQARNLVANGESGNIFVRDTCRGAVNCTPRTTAVDLAADGSAPNAAAGEHISMSADGSYVAFVSSASNLSSPPAATGPGGMPPDSHVFVRDMCVGSSAPRDCAPRTTMVSVDANANPLHALSPSISGDGRFVAYVSWNPDPSASGSAGTPQTFVRDTCAGAAASCTPHTYRLPGDSSSSWVGDTKPAISSDGRFVAFERWTHDAAASAGALSSRILMRDTCLGADAPSGCLPSTVTISISPDGAALKGASMFPSVSGDGRFVGFVSQSPDAESGSSASAERLYLRDTCQGAGAPENCVPATALIGEGVASIPGYASAFSPWVSPSGRFITFVAGAAEQSNMNEAPREGVLFVHDSCFGVAKGCAPRTYSVAAPSSDGSSRPALSVYKFTQIPLTADGAVAAFYSPFAVPAAPSSGMGDVYITVTNF